MSAPQRHLEALAELARFLGFRLVPIGPPRQDPPPAPAADPWPGVRIRALRAALQLTGKAFAERIGMRGPNAFVAISHMEHGRQRVPPSYHGVLEALEIEARKKIAAGPAPAPSPAPARESVSGGGLMRLKEACGCERLLSPGEPQNGPVVRQCPAHAPRKYRPEPPRTAPRPEKPPTVPLPRQAVGAGDLLCRCKHPARDHEKSRFRCFVCGTGHGTGCQMFRQEP